MPVDLTALLVRALEQAAAFGDEWTEAEKRAYVELIHNTTWDLADAS